jgi:putative transposase
MKKSRFSGEQITYAIRQVQSGTPPADVCRQLGCSEAKLLRLEEALREHAAH